MAKDKSTSIRDFVKKSLNSYYKNSQVKMADIASPDDANPVIKINDQDVYVLGIGNFNGGNILDSSTLQEVVNNSNSELNKINSEIININEELDSKISEIQDGSNIRVTIDENNSVKIDALGYTYVDSENEECFKLGNYNAAGDDICFSMGIGSRSKRRNAFAVLNDGSTYLIGLGGYNGLSISNVSTLQQVIDGKLDAASAAAGLSYTVVTSLPTQDISTNVIYLVQSTQNASNIYNEYLYVGSDWEMIGTTETDLNNYYTKTEIDASFYTKEQVDQTFSSIGHTHTISYNGSSVSFTSVSIYAPTVSGQADQFLKADGNGIPTWQTVSITDTKNTVGATTTTSQLYLVGAPYSTDSMQSYVNTDVYMQNGNLTAVAFYQSSDERLKNIKEELDIEKCQQLINDCSTIIYSLKTEEDKEQIGMIAQQVQKIFPEVVSEAGGYLAINYSRLSVIALKLIKDLTDKFDKLEKNQEDIIKRLEKLENKINE